MSSDLSPEYALSSTAAYTAERAGVIDGSNCADPWLVCSAVLMAQQAAALALRAAGDTIPVQCGATELLLRAASKDRLPAPYTLPFASQNRQDFSRLVEARNAFMHPRGGMWDIDPLFLSAGLSVSAQVVRHVILIQPILPDLIDPKAQEKLREDLNFLDRVAEFLDK